MNVTSQLCAVAVGRGEAKGELCFTTGSCQGLAAPLPSTLLCKSCTSIPSPNCSHVQLPPPRHVCCFLLGDERAAAPQSPRPELITSPSHLCSDKREAEPLRPLTSRLVPRIRRPLRPSPVIQRPSQGTHSHVCTQSASILPLSSALHPPNSPTAEGKPPLQDDPRPPWEPRGAEPHESPFYGPSLSPPAPTPTFAAPPVLGQLEGVVAVAGRAAQRGHAVVLAAQRRAVGQLLCKERQRRGQTEQSSVGSAPWEPFPRGTAPFQVQISMLKHHSTQENSRKP